MKSLTFNRSYKQQVLSLSLASVAALLGSQTLLAADLDADAGAIYIIQSADTSCSTHVDEQPADSLASGDANCSALDGTASVRATTGGSLSSVSVNTQATFSTSFMVNQDDDDDDDGDSDDASFVPVALNMQLVWANELANDSLTTGGGAASTALFVRILDDTGSIVSEETVIVASNGGIDGCVNTLNSPKLSAALTPCDPATNELVAGGGDVSLGTIVETGRDYVIQIGLVASAAKAKQDDGPGSEQLASSPALNGGSAPGVSWASMSLAVGSDAAAFLEDIEESIEDLEEAIEDLRYNFNNHTHTYLTGRGNGHNNTEATSTVPDGASTQPVPSEPDPEPDNGNGNGNGNGPWWLRFFQ